MSVAVRTEYAMRSLTAKERHFVLLILEGNTKSSAYRQAYRSHADPHVVSAWACRVLKRPAVRAALMMAEARNWAGLLSCGLDVDFVNWKKLTALGHDPAVPGYAQVKALLAAKQYRDRLDSRAKEAAIATAKATSEEIERLLLNGIDAAHPNGEPDDGFSLDSPLPLPSEAPMIRRALHQPELPAANFNFRTGPDNRCLEEHPFLRKPQGKRHTPF
jgi:hypothetical protein